MNTLSKCTALIALLLVTQMSFASSILGSFVPTYQYFKVTYPNSVAGISPSISKNFFLAGDASCGAECSSFVINTSPDSSKSGKITILIQMNGLGNLSGNLVLPLTVDTKGNVETPNTSYKVQINLSSASSLTATVTGNPESTSGYTILIQ